MDEFINKYNKELFYGKKPDIPEELFDNIPVETTEGTCVGYREPNIREIVYTINKIIKYLEYIDK